ncbi:uncharacterized protein LOC134826687 [Bolinopsis microptera]|uniref:uncharacterized protein LOC134826687 n=1 Tax=Bolinopsis microptera TaxID=2820187 RepID=UPI00307AB69C
MNENTLKFDFPTTQYWTTSSSWYNSTSSFTTRLTTEPEGDLKVEGASVGMQESTPDMIRTSAVTTPFSEGTMGTETNDTDSFVVPPSIKNGMELSKIMYGPFCAILLVTTAILLYLILRHFRHLIRLYLSLIFYSASQLFLFVVLTTSAVLQAIVPLEGYCDAVNTVEYVAVILPGYGILLVSIARWLCVAYPTKYKKLLNLRVQVTGIVVLVCLITLVTCLPLLGLCSNVWIEHDNLSNGGLCHLQTEGCKCTAFRWILVSVGFILPFAGVLIVYGLIVNLLINHKKKEKSLGKCKGSMKCGKVDYDYKPVTLGEKLSQLKAIGQDAIPWSILMILVLNTLTTLTWIPQIFAPELYLKKPISQYLALDLMYVAMLAAISFSPATYFLTTPAMRAEFVRMFSKRGGHKKFSIMSKNTESTVEV